ncbi:MAG TPA: UDP-N-acetylmuramate dehydrogenase [Wenzhouxiangella sp.]|nr:UDP-N-acetylmuramate dehydrogenase [Wenzhouxiangella sp.]
MPLPEHRPNAELNTLSTFRLPAKAAELIVIDHTKQLKDLRIQRPLLMLGGGSNTVFMADWPGTVLVNRLKGKTVEPLSNDFSRVRVAAGEDWHQLVRWCIDHRLHGLENLVLIPGSVGAAPIQNIGAYGTELADVLESVTVWDWGSQSLREISKEECDFDYRSSRFKTRDRDRFLITEVSLRLEHQFLPKTGYRSLSQELERVGAAIRPSARQVAAAVMRVRRHKLPDPARIANVGSFFKNPVLQASGAERLLAEHPALPIWPMPGGRTKISAGWLIEHCGWKGKSRGPVGVYPNHALVLVNHGKATAAQLDSLIDAISLDVERVFGLRLEPEALLAGRDLRPRTAP